MTCSISSPSLLSLSLSPAFAVAWSCFLALAHVANHLVEFAKVPASSSSLPRLYKPKPSSFFLLFSSLSTVTEFLPSPAKFIACASSLLNSSRSHAHNPLSLHLHLLGFILFAKLHARCRLPSRRAKRRRVPRRRGQLVQVSQPFNHLWF
jgi:hypothetical protein